MNPPLSVSLCYDYIVMVLHQFWYKYCIMVWLACDYVICHLHTLDICMVVRGCALLKKVSKDAELQHAWEGFGTSH